MINLLAASIPAGVQYALGGVLMLLSAVLVAIILMQSAKDKSLSGTIAGGAETFFGKTKGRTIDKMLSKLTIVLSSVFVVVAVALVIIINCFGVA